MSEEQKEVYEIKKSSVKQFLIIVCGSFVGCLIALLLMGQIMKPKFSPCPYGRMMPPPPMAQFHHRGGPAPDGHFIGQFRGERQIPHKFNAPDKKFNPAGDRGPVKQLPPTGEKK